jgi:hypothetical protein
MQWEIWINNESVKADTDTVKKWIKTGYVQPNDQIKRDKLNWLEVCRVPEFRAFFSEKTFSTLEKVEKERTDILEESSRTLKPIYQENLDKIFNVTCYHAELPPKYICTECGTAFCKDCAKLVGIATNAICQLCGSLCHTYTQATEKARILLDQKAPFSFSDLKAALVYPGEYIFQLFFISFIYSAALMVGLFGFPFGSVIANGMLFLCTSAVIKRIMTGDLEKSPLFDLTAVLAEPIAPAFIGLALLIVTTGPYELIQFGTVVYDSLKGQEGLVLAVVFSKYHTYFYPIFSWPTIAAILWVVCYYPVALLVAGVTENFWAVVNPIVGIHTVQKMGKMVKPVFLYYLIVCAIGLPPAAIMAMWVRPFMVSIFVGAMMMPLINFIILMFVGTIVLFPVIYTNVAIAYLLGRAIFKSPKQLGVLI